MTSSKLFPALASVLFLAVLASGGCSSSSSDPATTTGTDAGVDTYVAPCSNDPDPGATCVRTVSGSVTDVDGHPLGGLVLSVCADVCFYSSTKADGTFAAKIDSNIVAGNFSVLAHGRPDYASLYQRLPAGATGDVSVPTLKIPKYTGGTTLPSNAAPASTITQGDVTLVVPADTAFDLDVEDLGIPTGRQLRVGEAKVTDLPDFAKSTNAVALYGLGPFSAKMVKASSQSSPFPTPQKVGVQVPNKSGLAAGTKVEFFVLGDNLLSKPISAGTAMIVAKGTVSADGATIATDAGEGISVLTWLGVRPAM